MNRVSLQRWTATGLLVLLSLGRAGTGTLAAPPSDPPAGLVPWMERNLFVDGQPFHWDAFRALPPAEQDRWLEMMTRSLVSRYITSLNYQVEDFWEQFMIEVKAPQVLESRFRSAADHATLANLVNQSFSILYKPPSASERDARRIGQVAALLPSTSEIRKNAQAWMERLTRTMATWRQVDALAESVNHRQFSVVNVGNGVKMITEGSGFSITGSPSAGGAAEQLVFLITQLHHFLLTWDAFIEEFDRSGFPVQPLAQRQVSLKKLLRKGSREERLATLQLIQMVQDPRHTKLLRRYLPTETDPHLQALAQRILDARGQ